MDESVIARIIDEIREVRDGERRNELLHVVFQGLNPSHMADIKLLVKDGPLPSDQFKNRVRLLATGLVVCVVHNGDPKYLAAIPTAYELVSMKR